MLGFAASGAKRDWDMNKSLKAGACLLALFTGMNSVAQAAVAAKCANPNEITALKTASVQQTLMNAGIGCGTNESESHSWLQNFNAFQTAYLTELRKSDALMLSMFKRLKGASKGDAAYNAFKTEVANNASMRRIKAMQDFCKTAEAVFSTALSPDRPKLADFIAGVTVEDATPVAACAVPVSTKTVAAKATPVAVPRPRPTLQGDASVAPAPVAPAPVASAPVADTVTAAQPAIPAVRPAIQ